MMHANRRYCVCPVASAEALARMLTQSTWTLCSGFYVEGHPETLFLNDATHEDGAAEFGIVRVNGSNEWTQVESITFSWTDEPKATEYIRAAIAGKFDTNDFARRINLAGRLHKPEEHGRCHFCA